MLYMFAGFNGYLLLGHYLRHTEWSLAKTLGWGIPMFVVGFCVTFFGFRHMTASPDCTEEQLELFFYYCSPNVVLMTLPLFMLCKKVRVNNQQIQKALANLTVCGFGVYMIHYFFTGPSLHRSERSAGPYVSRACRIADTVCCGSCFPCIMGACDSASPADRKVCPLCGRVREFISKTPRQKIRVTSLGFRLSRKSLFLHIVKCA